MKDRVLALAGLLQSVRLVQLMANNGQAETAPLAACIDSLFRFDAESTEAVYGNVQALQPGLRRVVAQLDGSDRDNAQTRIAMNVLHLERRFIGSASTVDAVRAGLEQIENLRVELGPTHPTVLGQLGELYSAQISPIGPRVLVQGNPVYLSQPGVVGDVRATLLAALRSAVLWRQLGGSYWQLLVSRRQLVETARSLLPPG